ncbi:triose-phosphate isomerase [Chloroflexota bacterium]
MRIPLIAGNWKMNTTVNEATELVKAMLSELNGVSDVEKVICPPFISLAAVADIIKGSSIKQGAQNLFYVEKGAYTGEISPTMLTGLCEFVIIGHSERRQYFSETGDIVNKKLVAALKTHLKPILCIGENLDENESGKTEEVIYKQMESSLSEISSFDGLVIAYEPIWAIGTGKAATGEQANKTASFIRQNLARLYNTEIAEDMRILYGGSVTAANAGEFLQQADIDGALVGGASLKASEFLNIIRQASSIKGSS